jgi:hypothetical protein
MSTSYNFKDNLTVDNNKYLKWLDKTGTSRANIIALDEDNTVNINSAYGNMRINNDRQDSYTFINSNNSGGNVIVGTKLGVGFVTTENMTSSLTLVKNGSIGVNTTVGTSDGYLGLSGSFGLNNVGGSRVLLYGNDHVTNPGNIHLYTGNVANGNINVYTANDSLKMQILQNGTLTYTPNGVTTRFIINESKSTFTNDLVITSTTESNNASTGAVQILGGIGIRGNLYVDGTISLNNATGNINFDSTQTSSSYTSGAIFLSGGMGISTTVNSSSMTAGGALSIAGGGAFGKDLYVGGKLTIVDTTPASSSQTGSLIVYGGMGINDAILSRSDASQIQIAPKTNGSNTEILFYSLNNFTNSSNTSSSWRIGQNVGSIGPGKFALNNSQYGNVLSASYDGSVDLNGEVTITNTTNSTDENNGGAFTVLGGAAFKKDVYIGGAITLAGGGTISGGGGSSEFASLTLTGTENAINLSTGSLLTFGGVTIQGEDDALSVTQGGSILTAGGVSIGKGLFVGGPVMQIPVGSTEARPNPARTGYIRYNSTTSQFEGFGPGGAWGSLGGVVDIAQTTKILASANPSTTDGNLYFYTIGSERMRINNFGNVGIGTTSQAHRLQVHNGRVSLERDDGIEGPVYQAILRTNSQTTGTFLFTDLYHNTFLYNSILNGSSSGGNLFIKGSKIALQYDGGDVAIGKTVPTRTLDVNGIVKTSFVNGDTGGVIEFGDENHSIYGRVNRNASKDDNLSYHASGGHKFYTSGVLANQNVKMTITSSGNVGINIDTPAYHLDVNGNVHVNSNLYVDGVITGGTETGSTFAYLTLTSTDDAINLSTGSLLTYGGITIQSPTDAESFTNGGSFLTEGGASIGKRLFVGDNVIVRNNIQSTDVKITSTENSSGIGTGGSLTVLGGASISKTLYVNNLTVYSGITSGSITSTGGITITSTENALGIGSGGSFTVLGGGSISKDLYVGGTVTSSSDIRLKTNVEDFTTSKMLDIVDNIRTIRYNYIDDETRTPYVGFIAQDFVEHFPELLRCPDGGYYSLDYQKVSVILMECVKELKRDLEDLRKDMKQELKEIKPARKRINKIVDA